MLSYTRLSSVNIALDATPLAGCRGGVPRYTQALALALSQQFPEDRYSLISDQIFPPPADAPANLLCQSYASRRWWSWGLPRVLAKTHCDLFHGTDFAVPYAPIRPSVLTLHDLSPWLDRDWQPDAERVRRRTPILLRTRAATMVITPSEVIRRAAIERFALAPERVMAVPLAAGEIFRRVDTAPPAIPYFLFVGTLEPRKNIPRLLEAWREVRRGREVDLVIAGRTRADFPPLLAEAGLHLLGEVPDEQLPGLYSGAVACVYPSLYEGYGLPVLEAMQCGTLVITSRDPAIQEVTAGNAIHVDASDTRAIAEAMAAAFGDHSRMRQGALARARCFSWAATARRTREVYDAAIRIFSRS
jgi:glycosyltransferase involved in cell wall biosynthesis